MLLTFVDMNEQVLGINMFTKTHNQLYQTQLLEEFYKQLYYAKLAMENYT